MQRVVSPRKSRVGTVDLDRLYRTRVIGGGLWSPDGKWVAFTSNAGGRHNIYLVPSTGGFPLQLTVSDQRQSLNDWSPSGEWIAFQSDYDGNEQWDLFLVSIHTGEVRNLTGTPEVSEEGARFSPNGRYLAYVAKPRTGSSYEVHVRDLRTGATRLVSLDTPADWTNSGPVWSPDTKLIAYTRTRADHKAGQVRIARLDKPADRVLTPPGDHLWRVADYSPTGASLLVVSDALNRFQNVALLDPRGHRVDWLTRENWDCDAGRFDPSGRWATWEVNRDGNQELWRTDLKTGRARRLSSAPGLAATAPGGYSPDGSRILFYYSGPREPNDLYAARHGGGPPLRLTNSNLAGVCNADLVEPQLVRYRSADGMEIPAWVYVPYNLKRDASNPAVVHIHGGPSSQVVNGFQRGIQFLVNRGYIVVAPNYRGSTGYGKDFEEKNRFDMGGGDLADVVAAAAFLRATGFVDPRRIGVMGGSYGGYLTMMALTKAPDIWAAGVAIVPFVNWFTELEHEDPILRQWDLATMGDPVANRALYEDRSPIYFIDNIRAPVLILAGANDPRCPKSESDQVAAAIRRRGGVVEYRFYENEGHGFSRTENAVDSFQRTADFLNRYLK